MKLTKEEKIEIKNLYLQNKLTFQEICQKYNIARQRLYRILRQMGIKNTKHRPIDKYRKYIFNERYFELINSQEKAYWLGWLMSDGSVSKGSVKLQITDLEIIEQFKKCLEANIPITIIPPPKPHHLSQYRLNVCSTLMTTDLEKYGVVQNKVNKTKIPDINEKFIPHFIRGYFDGDGCINIGSKKSVVTITSSSVQLLKEIENFLKEKNILICDRKYIYSETDTYSYLRFARKIEIMNFFNLIYNDSNYKLLRKYNKFLEFQEKYLKHGKSKNPNKSSKYQGVCLTKRPSDKRYLSYITINHKRTHIGIFATELEAVQAYNNKIKELGLPDWMLNKIEN